MATSSRNLRSATVMPGRRDGQRHRTARRTTLLLLSLPAVLVLLPSCIVVAPAMLPTAVAFYVDRSREKWLALTVGPLNLCGSLFLLVELWGRGHSLGAAFAVLGDPYGWLIAFLGAAAGWGIYLGMPALVVRISAARQRSRLTQIHALQDALVKDWGKAVTDGGEPVAGEVADGGLAAGEPAIEPDADGPS